MEDDLEEMTWSEPLMDPEVVFNGRPTCGVFYVHTAPGRCRALGTFDMKL